jgi:hypothetical protein
MIQVTAEDVASGWRSLSESEAVTANGLLLEAQVMLKIEVPDLAAKDPDVVALVVKRMVRRVLKNPDGMRIRSESIDDYSEGGTVDSTLSTGELYASDQEIGWLGIVRQKKKAFEVKLGGS